MKITLYLTNTCPYCVSLKSYLDKKHVIYFEKYIDHDDQAREELAKFSGGFLGIPYLTIEKNNQTHHIIGFDKTKIDGILNQV
ncbi:hypothetical protein A2382_04210 [Candidatus Woesebacteria bacterium RIFOXYB1_FULL_38_16]|nr:MAG: hypothetical protein A2191_04285 [Candidatus Woesebacteria bacterium RIFOXYA1_FULL_38_9]OGM79774.1 MAG: hypothetical protein A2382_04210 [Candidatus Woesebacteria bacterium RIFOXYB1_FULL_38_16]